METIYNPSFIKVALSCQPAEPNDGEIRDMIDDVIYQLYGDEGLRALVKPGDRVVIKPNIILCNQGAHGEKGRAVITDPRIVRYLSERIREIIGWGNGADLKVVDALFSDNPDPSDIHNKYGFHWARYNKVRDNTVSPEDICYDYNCDGYLDGTSRAKLVNLDALTPDERDIHVVRLADGRETKVAFPKFLRTREQAGGVGEFTDVFVGIPVMKNHVFIGATGSLKLHYGFRPLCACLGDTGRRGHDGFYIDWFNGRKRYIDVYKLEDYLVAQHIVRSYDLVVMDCLTANRNGPGGPTGTVSYGADLDETVDYICTNAIIASTDAVAVDSVETALCGYRADSVTLPKRAEDNGVGVCDPSGILLDGGMRFMCHKLRLVEKYGVDNRYPLSTSGNAVIDDVRAKYSVTCESYTKTPDENGLLHVTYRIHLNEKCNDPGIVRIDLLINGEIAQSKIGDTSLEGAFSFRYEEVNNMNHSYVVGVISTWDKAFNNVNSVTEFFVPPAD
jgi:uncharacterized protein (DUF362 family)